MTASSQPQKYQDGAHKKQWQRQRLWRWHFWAGLMVLPLAIVLSLSGAVYVFKPQYQQWYQQSLLEDLRPATSRKSPLTLVAGLQQQYPDAQIKTVTLPDIDQERLLKIEARRADGLWVFYLDRHSGKVLAASLKDHRLMRWVKKLHGELQLGDWGSYVVEFMAHWMIVLIISGLYLVFSRQLRLSKGRWGLALTRALFPLVRTSNKGLFWRRLHALIGVWMGLLILIFLVSGLPWTQVWGSGFKSLQQSMGWSGSQQQRSNKMSSAGANRATGTLWNIRSASSPDTVSRNPNAAGFNLNQVVAVVTPMALAPPVQITVPKQNKAAPWLVRSMAADRSLRVSLQFDSTTGLELSRVEFGDHHPVQRLVSYGVAFHEGALFGYLNQLIAVLAALAVVLMAVSAAIMWWRRRPQARWVPAPVQLTPLSWSLRITVLGLCIVLPLFGGSLLVIIALDRLLQAACKRGSGNKPG